MSGENTADAIERYLNRQYHYGQKPSVKPIMGDKQRAHSLSEVVFNSLFFSDYRKHFVGIDPYVLDCLSERVPLLVKHEYWGTFCIGSPEVEQAAREAGASLGVGAHTDVSILGDEFKAVEELAEVIQIDAEVALMCWTLAKEIAAFCWWTQGNYAYDCMVQLGLLPMYDYYEETCTKYAEKG